MIWLLLVIYQIKHFVADYPLQGKYMLGKFKAYPDFIMPLLAHSAVHGVSTFAIALCFKGVGFSALLGAIDMGIHFLVDRVKASPELLGRFKAFTKADYESHLNEVGVLERSIRGYSLMQETLPKAAEAQAELNEVKLAWHEKVKSNTFFWWSLGADQMAHHLTHYLLIWMML